LSGQKPWSRVKKSGHAVAVTQRFTLHSQRLRAGAAAYAERRENLVERKRGGEIDEIDEIDDEESGMIRPDKVR
jgi:hypothetical protein